GPASPGTVADGARHLLLRRGHKYYQHGVAPLRLAHRALLYPLIWIVFINKTFIRGRADAVHPPGRMRGLRGVRAGVPGGGDLLRDDLPDKWQMYAGENARFFAEPLPGRDEPLGSP